MTDYGRLAQGLFKQNSRSKNLQNNRLFPEKDKHIRKIQILYHTFVKIPFVMPFRYNKILKLFAILLFNFEMLAPAVLMATPETYPESQHVNSLNESEQAIDFLTHLIFEEVSSEEREGKDDCLIGISFIELFSLLQKFEPIRVTWSLPKEHFDTHPPLFTLHRVLLI